MKNENLLPCHADWRELVEHRLNFDFWQVGDALLLLANIFPVEAEISDVPRESLRYGLIEAPVVLKAGLIDRECNSRFHDQHERLLIQAGKRLGKIRELWVHSGNDLCRYSPRFFVDWSRDKGHAPSWAELLTDRKKAITQATLEPGQERAAADACHGKRWTPEKLAELKAYRALHGTKKAADYYGITDARVRQILPSEKPQPKGYSAFTHRSK